MIQHILETRHNKVSLGAGVGLEVGTKATRDEGAAGAGSMLHQPNTVHKNSRPGSLSDDAEGIDFAVGRGEGFVVGCCAGGVIATVIAEGLQFPRNSQVPM